MTKRIGAVYLAVLMSSLIVASLAMAAVSAAHYYAKDLNDESDFRHALMAADAALEWAVADINATASWRTAKTNNLDTSLQLGNATIRYRLIDADGNLSDNPLDACDVLVTASVGSAACAWQAALEPNGASLKCLNYALAAGNDARTQSFAMWCSDGIVGAVARLEANNSSSITADCEYGDSISGPVYGAKTALSGGLELPDPSLLELYVMKAVPISVSQLPMSSGSLVIDRQLLSSTTNTVSGAISENGIYSVDCAGNSIVISNSRLACTLVLTNVGPNSRVDESVYWEAAQANYPALLVGGDFDLSMKKNPLQEASVGLNLNPVGTPFRGTEDSSLATVYPSQIRGLIYVSGTLHLNDVFSENEIAGVLLVGETITGVGDLFLNFRSVFSTDPPPGFRKFDQVRVATGTVRRVPVP